MKRLVTATHFTHRWIVLHRRRALPNSRVAEEFQKPEATREQERQTKHDNILVETSSVSGSSPLAPPNFFWWLDGCAAFPRASFVGIKRSSSPASRQMRSFKCQSNVSDPSPASHRPSGAFLGSFLKNPPVFARKKVSGQAKKLLTVIRSQHIVHTSYKVGRFSRCAK